MVSKFKYTESCSQSYAPGYSIPGSNGNNGELGKNGNGIFYISYELNNSYILDLVLQKIDNNQVLSDDSVFKLSNRPYAKNDIIISSEGTVYRLIDSIDNTHNFNIEEIGKTNLFGLGEIPDLSLAIYDYTGSKVIKGETVILDMSTNIPTCVPSNRCRKFSPNSADWEEGRFNNDDFLNRGIWLKMSVVSEDPDAADSDLYEYDIKFYFHNEKVFQYGTIPCKASDISETNINPMQPQDSSILTFKFEKILNVHDVKCNIVNNSTDIAINAYLTNENKIEDNFTTLFLSDMSLDKLCLQNNNVKSSLGEFDNKYYYYENEVKSYNSLEDAQNALNKCSSEHSTSTFLQSSYVSDGTNKIFNEHCGSSLYFSKLNPDSVHDAICNFIEKGEAILVIKNKITNNVLYKKVPSIQIIDAKNSTILINE